MSVYKKLQQARVMLHNTHLNKSGKNKFANFNYFELGDFIPQVTEIFNKVGLCGIVSFTADTAYLTVHDVDGDGFTTFTSPLVYASVEKTQPIQNLGSTHTYLRRYLWLMCMEIVENDVVDATAGSDAPAKTNTVSPPVKPPPPPPPPVVDTPAAPKPLAGNPGEFQMKVSAKPEGDPTEWMELIKTSSGMLLDMATCAEDVMVIFKKNKVIFDEVKATDPTFFKGMMAKFTETTNKFKE